MPSSMSRRHHLDPPPLPVVHLVDPAFEAGHLGGVGLDETGVAEVGVDDPAGGAVAVDEEGVEKLEAGSRRGGDVGAERGAQGLRQGSVALGGPAGRRLTLEPVDGGLRMAEGRRYVHRLDLARGGEGAPQRDGGAGGKELGGGVDRGLVEGQVEPR